MDNGGYHFFSHYWWLIFPLFWMISSMVKLWSRHARANRALDLIKSYADQGKEPPTELLKSLQGTDQDDCYGRSRYRNRGPRGWVSVFLFGGVAAAFLFLGLFPEDGIRDHANGLFFVAIIMGALALGSLVTMLAGRRDDQSPPK
jgi:hypothetical protein